MKNNFLELSLIELVKTNGGEPNRNTSLEYDISWGVGRAFRAFWDGVSGRYAGSDSFVLG